MPDNSVDLVLTSPPYEDARLYGIDCKLTGQIYVNWCFERFRECYRVSRGLTAWVVEGRTKQFTYSATPFLLMADLHRSGVALRKPVCYHRDGIPGSGGPDWLKNNWETIICASHGKLPWSDNTACGHPPVYGAGGEPSHRTRDGHRTNAKTKKPYVPPSKANPGNVLRCSVGGGHMGHPLAHENEAPFPLTLAEFFVKSFCPPGGVVLDPFAGSGTVMHAACLHGRQSINVDIRENQCDLIRKRLGTLTTGEQVQ